MKRSYKSFTNMSENKELKSPPKNKSNTKTSEESSVKSSEHMKPKSGKKEKSPERDKHHSDSHSETTNESISNSKANIDRSKKVWIRCGDYTLTEFDRHVIQKEDEWLTDTIINSSQFLLKKQFPTVKGLQNVLLNETQEFVAIEENQSFVQIINDSANHWIVLSNVTSIDKNKDIAIYDSNCVKDKTYTKSTMDAIHRLMKLPVINVRIPYCTQQEDSHQSGLYAIAFAHVLCSGGEAADILFSHKADLLRRHLHSCLEKGDISRFPTGSQILINEVRVTPDE